MSKSPRTVLYEQLPLRIDSFKEYIIQIKNMKKIFPFLFASALLASCAPDRQAQEGLCQTEINSLYQELPFDMPVLQLPEFPARRVSIVDYGAISDGTTLNTQAIQAAIDDVSAQGGGYVDIPAGIWITGPIVLKNNVCLHTAHNALIQFTADFYKYPIIDASFEGVDTKRCQSPISAISAENIAIIGQGVFNGTGDAWRPLKKSKVTSAQWKAKIEQGGVLSDDGNTWWPTEGAKYAQQFCRDQNVPEGFTTDEEWEYVRAFLRPVMVNLIKCKNILLDGVTFENSPAWNLHPLMCENVIMNNLTVRNPWYSQNGDGVDVESCKNTIIRNCNFDVGDDAICMKSGKNEDGRKRAIPTENVIVDGCTVYHGHGGFVVGSEMSGGISNIYVADCLFIGTDVGLRFKSTRGRGGIVENIHIKNINMANIATDPLLFDLFYGGKGAGEETDEEIAARAAAPVPEVTIETPQFKDIYIENIMCNGAKRAMYFNGLPEMKIKNVHISNAVIKADKGAEFHQTDGLTINNMQIINKTGEPVFFNEVTNLKTENISDAHNNIIAINNK